MDGQPGACFYDAYIGVKWGFHDLLLALSPHVWLLGQYSTKEGAAQVKHSIIWKGLIHAPHLLRTPQAEVDPLLVL
jgi:hypothetical protein